MNLKQKTIAGVTWSSIAHLASQAFLFGILIVLTRLLTPEDFGLVAMIVVFIGFASILNEFGFGAALIQKQDIAREHTDSIFWLNLLVGLAFSAIFYVVAPLLASFYATPELETLSRVLGLVFVLTAFGIVPRALLKKTMAFDRLAKIEITSVLVSGGVAIGAALNGWGVWTLVIQSLLKEGMGAGLAWMHTTWRPRWRFSLRAVRDLFGYSIHLSGFNTINYWARNIDNLLVGKFFSSYSLGIYTRAYLLMLLPIKQIIGLVSQVMFSALSAIQHDRERVKRIYLRVVQVIALLVFPLMTGLLVLAEPFVLTLFGEPWADVAPLIQILCFVGMMQSLMNPTGWIYTSQGRTDWMFRWGLFGAGTQITAIVIGVALGSIQTVATAYLIANVLLFYPCLFIPGKLIDLRFGEVIRAVAGSFVCACVMAVAVWGLGALLPDDLPPWTYLAVQIPSGMFIYWTLLHTSKLKAYQDAWTLLSEQWQRRFRGLQTVH